MSEKPHTVALGAFITGAILIVIALMIFLLGTGLGVKEKVVMVFDGSVKGLNVGAPLALRGVQVGQVTKIELVLDYDEVELIMLVEADFDPNKIRMRGEVTENLFGELLSRGLRAQLNSQSLLTGLLYIQLDFFPESELNLESIDSPHLQLPTIPTELERITRKLQELDIADMTEDLEAITNNLSNMFSNKEFQSLPVDLSNTLASLTKLSEQMSGQLSSSGPKLDSVLDEAAQTVDIANTELPKMARLVDENLSVLDEAIGSFEEAMQGIDQRVSDDSGTIYKLDRALLEITRAARALQSLAGTLEEQPESLIRGRSGD